MLGEKRNRLRRKDVRSGILNTSFLLGNSFESYIHRNQVQEIYFNIVPGVYVCMDLSF